MSERHPSETILERLLRYGAKPALVIALGAMSAKAAKANTLPNKGHGAVPEAVATNPPSHAEQLQHILKSEATKVKLLKEALASGRPIMWDGAIRFKLKRPYEKSTLTNKNVVWDSFEKDKRKRIIPSEVDALFTRPILIKDPTNGDLCALAFNAGPNNQDGLTPNMLDFSLTENNLPNLLGWEILDVTQAAKQGEVTFYKEPHVDPIMRKIRASGSNLLVNDRRSLDWGPTAVIYNNYQGVNSGAADMVAGLRLEQILPPSNIF